ncbi:MAG: hypothetical protein ACOC1O_01030 [bacterium]
MKEIIQEKLDNMNDLNQRKILKNIVWDVFKELIDYQNEVNNEIENRLFNELKDNEDNYTIYNTIIKIDKIELVNDFLHPLRNTDVKKEIYDKKDLLKKMKYNEPVKISSIFIKKSYPEIENIKKENKVYSGYIISNNERIKLKVILKYNKDYIKIEEDMYDIFMENGIKWTTVNNPYIRKYFDVIIVDCEEKVKNINDFEEIVFDLEEMNEYKYVGYIPVWNIKKIKVKGEGFPLPAHDKVNYEHIIPFENNGINNGYLVEPDQNVVSVKKTKNDIIITSRESSSIDWDMYVVIQDNSLYQYESYDFNLLSNKRKDGFLSNYINKGNKIIRSYTELNRLINSFDKINYFHLKKIEILNEQSDEDDFTFDFNYYINDEIRSDKFRRILILRFSPIESNYLKYDILSFIVSEIQQYLPEYICKGVIE